MTGTSRPSPRSGDATGPGIPEPTDAFFRHIVAGMRNGVLAMTRAGNLALLNEEGYRIFGVEPHPGDLGKPIAEVLRAHPEVVRQLLSAFDLHMLPNRAETRLRPSGKVLGYTLAFVRDDAGEIAGVAMFFKDLTRVEQLEERERLRDRLAAVGEMAAAIAHEVKNPLAGIEVMAGLLRRKIVDIPDAQAVLSDIIAEAKMANAIVQEVLEFVRPIRLQVEHTGIAEAVDAAVHLADTKAARGSIAVDVSVPADLPHIQADQHQLTQLFTNLLINAYEAMEGKGRVGITASTVLQDDGGDGREAVRVEMQDNGPGMLPEVAEHVFDPFYTTKAQGSGLGLAIVRKIVDAHDGQIDLRTAPGGGTLIRVTLPVSVSRDAL
ncbi:MAG TPA: ATP-binding protein [Vicinamibacterales bacterium]|jgi:signal transduction histidine kinase|nr:ATP-binding protein [Vicinamibacterales bacterium]